MSASNPRTLLLLAVAAGACAGPTGPQATDEPIAVRLQASGNESISLRGVALVLPLRPADYRETDPRTGATIRSAVTPLLLIQSVSSPSGPSLFIGVLGILQPGTYHVRRTLTPLQSNQEVFAEFVVPEADGWSRHYPIDGGELTITSVRPVLAGTLTMGASQVLRLRADAAVGSTVRSTPSALTVTAAFGKDPTR